MHSRLFVLAILVLVATLTTPAIAQQKLYWTDPNLHTISRSNLDGSNVETILSTGEDFAYIAASESLGKIFFTIGSPTPQLWSADFLGQNRQLLATFDTANYTRGLSFSPANSKLYWSSFHGYQAGNGKIRSINANGTGLTDVFSLTEPYPYGMAIDSTAGKMYWLDTVSEKRIERANLDGTSRETVLNTSVGFNGQVAVDSLGQMLYWTNNEAGTVNRANLHGLGFQSISTLSLGSYDAGIAVDGAAGKVYWTDTQLDRIYRANLDGTDKVAIISSGLSAPTGLVILTVPEPQAAICATVGLLAICGYIVIMTRKSPAK